MGAGYSTVPTLLLLLAGCAASQEQAAETRLECEIDGHFYAVSHPWACLREGGRVIEVSSEPSAWITQAVKVGWQGRTEIKSGRLHYVRIGREGALRLELPEADDECQGSYTLKSPTDADWTALCDSGQVIAGHLFMNEGGISISARGKDAEGRSFGFYPQAGEG
ncbi:MAG: hypothetical protein RH942_04960 [Kiloniellaceae bacterium]